MRISTSSPVSPIGAHVSVAGGFQNAGRGTGLARIRWLDSCHEHELIKLAAVDQALDGVEVASLLDRGFRGLARARDYNREQAGLRALVEQSIAHLANAWALRRWRGLLYRIRDVFRAAGALICLGRWLHRIPA